MKRLNFRHEKERKIFVQLTGERIFLRLINVTDAYVLFEQTQNETLRYLTGTTATFSLEQIE